MRRYQTKRVDAVLDEMSREIPLLRRVFIERELTEIWKRIPDEAIANLGVTLSISDNEHLLVQCPTPLSLSYMRSQQEIMKKVLSPLVRKWELRGLKVILCDGQKSSLEKKK